ncbi:FAD-dependent monooxygenase [Chelativorans sp. Marseille-P2723]|uniref:FAD-dependent monooxygenase n=1 Tax=Chelativorans sp. Marseille-P2723 TaxID=2709133 RepID=UPI00156E3273|nr:FAD-dependent monooxygenase [Chelativorans sp. Marseille-P2723]
MDEIVIAGAGIGGLSAALAFAAGGASVTILERAERLEEVGAGLQLSPNATRLLKRWGVLARLEGKSVRPQAIFLKDAGSLNTLAAIPLGQAAERRWGAPYMVAHRADLQRALLDCVTETATITLRTGVAVTDVTFEPEGVRFITAGGERSSSEATCRLLVGADGVWSQLRKLTGGGSRFTGQAAFRAILRREAANGVAAAILPSDGVVACLAPDFHLIAYPLRGGSEINLVAITRSPELSRGWASDADMVHLLKETERAAPPLLSLIKTAGAWTTWPVHEVRNRARWVHPGVLALIGDAAHALPPYLAQGAAMAIEDAATLAALYFRGGAAQVLHDFERLRRPRLARVARRGSFNRFVWHASGPVAFARNLALRLRDGQKLAADLDWLYGYDAAAAVE